MSESAPWSQPGLPMKMLMRSWRADAPFRLRLRADPAQWRWLLAFLANSRASTHHAGRMRNLMLGRYSLDCLQRTRAQLGNEFAYDDSQKGILQLVPAGASIDLDHIRDQTARGVPVSWLGPQEIAAVEPALAAAVEKGLFAAGVWGKADESGDAHLFAQRLVETFPRARFSQYCNMAVTRIISSNGQVQGVLSASGALMPMLLLWRQACTRATCLPRWGSNCRFMALRATRSPCRLIKARLRRKYR